MTKTIETNDRAPKVLIADDDPEIVAVLSDRLTNIGFEVQTATNGLQAVIKANRNPPDIMIVDVNMPGIDGLSVCAHLLDSTKVPMNVIVMTGNSTAETIERCEALGAFSQTKGPHFWDGLTSALNEIVPGMAANLGSLQHGPVVSQKPRVLLVDDDENVGNFLSSRLGKFGVDVVYATNAAQGYQMACRKKPTVITSDYFMPDGDGLWLLHKLRSTSTTRNIPFLVLTGKKIDEASLASLRREVFGGPGAVQILIKSFDTSELLNAVGKFCGLIAADRPDDRLAEVDRPDDRLRGKV